MRTGARDQSEGRDGRVCQVAKSSTGLIVVKPVPIEPHIKGRWAEKVFLDFQARPILASERTVASLRNDAGFAIVLMSLKSGRKRGIALGDGSRVQANEAASKCDGCHEELHVGWR
jgi:hypothetical protein